MTEPAEDGPGPALPHRANLQRTGRAYQPAQPAFHRRKSAMKSGLVQTRVFHSGHSSKRRLEGLTRGARISRTVRPVFRASLLSLR